MTYVRMTGGRDRGHVKDFSFTDAQEMIASGRAAPVDMTQPGALDFQELAPLPSQAIETHAGAENAFPAPVVAEKPAGGLETRSEPAPPLKTKGKGIAERFRRGSR